MFFLQASSAILFCDKNCLLLGVSHYNPNSHESPRIYKGGRALSLFFDPPLGSQKSKVTLFTNITFGLFY